MLLELVLLNGVPGAAWITANTVVEGTDEVATQIRDSGVRSIRSELKIQGEEQIPIDVPVNCAAIAVESLTAETIAGCLRSNEKYMNSLLPSDLRKQ